MISQGFKKSAGTMTTTVLGANDMLLTEEKKKAAEVIVDQNAGKRFEGQSTKGKKNPGEEKYDSRI